MDWKFKEGFIGVEADDFWYDLIDGGYHDPEDYLDDEKQIKELKAAILLLEDYRDMVVVEGGEIL